MSAKAAPGLTSGTNQFALDLFKSIALPEPDINVFFSPLSVAAALAIAYVGSRSETQSQMAQVLHCSASQQEVAMAFQTLRCLLRPPRTALTSSR